MCVHAGLIVGGLAVCIFSAGTLCQVGGAIVEVGVDTAIGTGVWLGASRLTIVVRDCSARYRPIRSNRRTIRCLPLGGCSRAAAAQCGGLQGTHASCSVGRKRHSNGHAVAMVAIDRPIALSSHRSHLSHPGCCAACHTWLACGCLAWQEQASRTRAD